MANKEVLNTDLLRARIMELEYDEVTASEVRRIYIEETGQEPPSDITIYHSSDFEELRDGDWYSGFDGTVIHFYDEDRQVNQVYTITRGSEPSEKDSWKPKDWVYNLFGIGMGQNDSQYRDALDFDRIVTANIQEDIQDSDIPVKKIGLGHSLGGNLVTTLQLTTDRFENVYVINHAPPNAYQLALIDIYFRMELNEKFGLNLNNNFKDIYKVDREELKDFTEKYYKAKIDEDTINIVTIEEELLYAVSSIRGFIEIGNREVIKSMENHNGLHGVIDQIPVFAPSLISKFIEIGNREVIESTENHKGLHALIEQIPDESWEALQLYMTEYVDAYNEGGFDAAVQAMTGFRPEVIDAAIDVREAREQGPRIPLIKNQAMFLNEFLQMVVDVGKKLPTLLEHVQMINENLDPILDVFVEAGIMDEKDKMAVLQEVKKIEFNLKAMQGLSIQMAARLPAMVNNPRGQWEALMKNIEQMKEINENIKNRFIKIREHMDDTLEVITDSGKAHKLDHVVQTLGEKESRSYYNGHAFLVGTEKVPGGGERTITVSLTSAVKTYQQGVDIYNRLEQHLSALKTLYNVHYVQDFEDRKQKLVMKINDMEANPRAFQKRFLGTFSSDAEQIYRIKKISVHEDIPSTLPESVTNTFESMFAYYETEIEKGREVLEKIKESVKYFVDKDEEVANYFSIRYE